MSSASQVLRQADSLKVTVSDSSKSISELWVPRQRLEDLYKKLLLMDLEYALDKKVEQDLWNHAFKNQINILQAQAKDKINAKRGESQASLNLFLENASGFYLQFLQLVCTTFKLDLPFRRKSSAFGVMKEKCPLKTKINLPTKNACYYICQHCLVHLGDIARYRQQIDQAKTYYRHAANLVPQNGQPYNQMAILEAARGNRLLTVFYYIRSLDVRHPFPVAATNLEKFYTKLAKDVVDLKGKLSMTEVVSVFLQFHSLVHLTADLTKAGLLKDRLLASFPAHITSQSFQSNLLLQFVMITIFSIHNAKSEPGNDVPIGPAAKVIQFCRDEEKSFELVFSFVCGLLECLIQNTPKQEQRAKEFFTLPSIKILLDWILLQQHLLQLPLLATSSLWNHFAKLLNNLQSPPEKENVTDLSRYVEQPLPEDVDLRCFRPIEKSQSGLSYSKFPVENLSPSIEIQLRCHRLLAHGKKIAQESCGIKVLTFQCSKSGKLEFQSSISVSPAQSTEKKGGRHNVAMQTIYQKHGQKSVGSGSGPQKATAASTTGQKSTNMANTQKVVVVGGSGDSNRKLEVITGDSTASGQRSPKYILGVPTSEPQFMKHGGQGRLNQSQLPPRLQNLQNQQRQEQHRQEQLQQTSPSRNEEPSLSPNNYSYHGNMVNNRNQFQDTTSPQHDSNLNPQQKFNMSAVPPSFQQERFRMTSPAQGQNQPFSEGGGPMPINPRMPPPTHMLATNHNMPGIPQNIQLLNALRMANQIQQIPGSSSPKSMMGMTPPNQGMMAPHMNYGQASEAQAIPGNIPPPRMIKPGQMLPSFPAFTSYMGNTPPPPPSGTPRPAAPTNMAARYPSDAMVTADGKHPLAGFSPLTIQPPKLNIIDTRLTSTFQGHAEGTPKPEHLMEKRELENIVVTTVTPPTQPGVYSLFSGATPWSVSIQPPTDTKSIGSSPFSSAASSMRNSPEHSIDCTPPNPRGSISSPKQIPSVACYDQIPRFNNPDNWNQQMAAMMMGETGHLIPPPGSSNGPVYAPNNIQQFWTNQGVPGMTPLERLLEMQRQRQTDPN